MARTRGFDEDQIVAAVLEKFRETGYAATSLDDIMSVSGLGKGSIYSAFGSKRALFLRAFNTYCSDVAEGLSAALHGPDDTAHLRLLAALRSSTEPPDTSLRRACFLARTTAELAPQDEEVASRARATFAVLADALTGCVRQAQTAGHVDPENDPVAVGRFLLSVLRGNEALAEARVDPAVLRDAIDIAIAIIGLQIGTNHRP
jgi:TetR/AcrR family transcriptional repressor of nem operon